MNSNNDASSPKSQHIEVTDFDAPGAPGERVVAASDSYVASTQAARAAGASWWHSQFNLMLAVFTLLVAAAGLFVLLTPAPNVATLTSTIVTADGNVSQGTPTASNAAEQAPWDESRRTQARVDSQDILADLLSNKKTLEAKNVNDWAPERFDAALALAQAGDEFYKQQDFANAIERYQASLNALKALNGAIPEILKAKVSEGLQAIDEGKSALAKAKFSEAIALDANHIPALQGLDRAKKLDQVLALLKTAGQEEQAFDSSDEINRLLSAEKTYQTTLDLDGSTGQASEGLVRVKQKLADKRYRDAMTQGFNALFAKSYAKAKRGFSTALKTKPGDVTAANAYQLSLASDKRTSLSSLLSSGKGFEKNEEWDSALSTYQAILQRDPNQVNAKLGKIRSQARSQLNTQLIEALSDPLALSRATQKEKATKVLNDARAISSKGTKLNAQIAELENALQQLDSTVKVAIKSDALTEITITKLGARKLQLGKFKNKNLALKPGRYVISGTRIGFRDVRNEIDLLAGNSQVQAFDVRCVEPIGDNAQLSSLGK